MKGMARILAHIAPLGLVLAVAVTSRSTAVAANGVDVAVDVPAQVVEGETFSVSVDITDITDFDAGQFDVSFNESLIQLDNVTVGLVGSTQIPVALWNRMSAETYRIIVNVPGVPGVSGSGRLAVLHFRANSSVVGTSTVSLSDGFLNNNSCSEIPATWAGDSVTVCEPTIILRPGDANGDGALDAADITALEKIVVGLEGTTRGADANQDGTINAADITALEAINVTNVEP